MKHNKGFTLVELLVVIAIIGILMAVLLPRLFGTREDVNVTACKLKLRNLYIALMRYADGIGGGREFPWAGEEGGIGGFKLLFDYGYIEGKKKKDLELFVCPATKDKPASNVDELISKGGPDESEKNDIGDTCSYAYSKERLGPEDDSSYVLVADDTVGEKGNHKRHICFLTVGGRQLSEIVMEGAKFFECLTAGEYHKNKHSKKYIPNEMMAGGTAPPEPE